MSRLLDTLRGELADDLRSFDDAGICIDRLIEQVGEDKFMEAYLAGAGNQDRQAVHSEPPADGDDGHSSVGRDQLAVSNDAVPGAGPRLAEDRRQGVPDHVADGAVLSRREPVHGACDTGVRVDLDADERREGP